MTAEEIREVLAIAWWTSIFFGSVSTLMLLGIYEQLAELNATLKERQKP